MDDSQNLTVRLDDREPRVRRRHQVAKLGGGRRSLDRDDAVPGHHRIGGLEIAEVDRSLEEHRLRRGEVAALGGRVDDQIEFLGRDRHAEFLDRLDAEQAQEPVGGPVEEADDRPGDTEIEQRRRGDRKSHRLGFGDRQVLRGEFAEHHLSARGEDQRCDQRDPERRRFGHAERLEEGFDRAGDHRLGDETQQQRGHGDPELGTREHEAQPAVDGECPLGTSVARLGPGDERRAPGRDEAELAGHEVAVRRDEHQDAEDAERGQHGLDGPGAVQPAQECGSGAGSGRSGR